MILALSVLLAACNSDDGDTEPSGLLTKPASCDEAATGRLGAPTSYDGAVLVNLPIAEQASDGTDELFELECRLAVEVDASGAGGYDGNVIGEDEFVIYLYGPDARVLSDAVAGILESFSVPAGSYMVVRQGEPGSPETRVDLR